MLKFQFQFILKFLSVPFCPQKEKANVTVNIGSLGCTSKRIFLNMELKSNYACRSPSILFGAPPSIRPPDIICPIILCMFGSVSMDVAMFISIGLFKRPPRSNAPGGNPAATGKKRVKINRDVLLTNELEDVEEEVR